MISGVDFSFDVLLQDAMNDIGTEDFSVFRSAFMQRIGQQLAERSAQPFVRGNVEANLLPAEDLGRKLVFHQFFQNEFLRCPSDLQRRRQRCGKLHNTMIEKRRADFHGMSHAHAVAFNENVIRKKIFLIKPEIRSEIIDGLRKRLYLTKNPIQ